MQDLGLVLTLRGGHLSQHEAAWSAERLFECLVVRADHSRDVGADRTRLRHANPRTSGTLFHFDNDSKFSPSAKLQLVVASSLRLAAHCTRPFKRRCVDENYSASPIQAVM